MSINKIMFFIGLSLVFVQTAVAGETSGVDDSAELPFWEWQEPGISVRLVQRLPDQTRAFFQARGFSAAQAERIAQACVFQTIFKNTAALESKTVIAFDLAQWRVWHEGSPRPLKRREDWRDAWEGQAIESARVALEWSLLPSRQQFLPSDFNWGMSSYDLPPGSRFDLEMHWRQDNVWKSARLHDVQCAPDIHPDPSP